MAAITAIEPQKKKAGYYNLFIDGIFLCGISDFKLATLGLHVGQEVSESELEDIQLNVVRDKALNRAMHYLSFRPRSVQEVRAYLHSKDVTDDIIEMVVIELKRTRLLDDEAFARAWIKDRNALKNRSQRILSLELRQKGISRELIDQIVREEGKEAEMANLQRVIQKKIDLSAYADRSKLTRYLVQKGFSYGDITQALHDINQSE